MKKFIIICAAMLAVSCTMFGQDKEAEKARKAALKEATKQMDEADAALSTASTVYQALKTDPSNADNLAKFGAALSNAESLITTAVKNETVGKDPRAWNIAGRIETIKMNRLLEQRQATGEMDLNEFFENQFNIVDYFSKCDARTCSSPVATSSTRTPTHASSTSTSISTPSRIRSSLASTWRIPTR